jgi:hypothetical protein
MNIINIPLPVKSFCLFAKGYSGTRWMANKRLSAAQNAGPNRDGGNSCPMQTAKLFHLFRVLRAFAVKFFLTAKARRTRRNSRRQGLWAKVDFKSSVKSRCSAALGFIWI